MNIEALIPYAALALAAALGLWALAERGRAERATLEARMLRERLEAAGVLGEGALPAGTVAEALARFEAQVAAAERARAEERGGLRAQIDQLLAASAETQVEARKLAMALRRGSGVQGRWGEQMLRNVLELAGLRAGTDFVEQAHLDVDGAAHRPDVIVRLPGGGGFVIDAKCSLTAFLDAGEAESEPAREASLARHAQNVRAHVQGLAARAYWDKLELSPDFVALFLPGDGLLAAALERAPELMTQAMERRVILVTPSTLFALCKAVAYGWRVEQRAQGAAEIAVLGRELYKRLSVMGGHALAMGKALDTAVTRYNQFVGSLESQVLSQARRFEDLKGDHEGRTIPELPPIETAARPLGKLAVALTPAGPEPTSGA